MAHYTDNLNLYEKDPTTDGSQLFSITTMMNDNFDKIDTAVGNPSSLTTTAKTNLVSAINEVNAKDSLPSQSGNANKVLTTDGTTASWAYVLGMPIGTVFAVDCTADYVPDGALPCDGSEYNKSQFNALWTNYLTASTPLLKTCTYAEYATALSTYGSCPMFAVDTTNLKFKVPTIKDGAYITQAKSDSELGKSYNESLPNITGTVGGRQNASYNTGAFVETSGTNNTGSGSAWCISTVSFDASNSSSTYQDNAKVQGDNIRLRYFVQVATGQINQSQMDWSAWASGLASKADLSNFAEINPMIVSYVNGTSGYNIWANGYCEQWGYNTSASLTTISLLKTMANTNYQVICQKGVGGSNYPICVTAITTTSFTADFGYGGEKTYGWWKVCGYLADSEMENL